MHPGDAHRHQENRAFGIGLCLNIGFVVIEAASGLIIGSLALLADAGHNLVDVAGLLAAWMAQYLAQRASSKRRTYGWRKATAMAPLCNAMLILLVMGAIGWESVKRLRHAPQVPGLMIIVVAGVGFLVNAGTAWLFVHGRHGDLNRRGVFLHMAADAGVSLAVVLGGIGMLWTGWLWLDPAISLAVVTVVTLATWRLLRKAFDLILDAVPHDIDSEEVRHTLMNMAGIVTIHDLHIWAISTTETALTAHLVVSEDVESETVIHEASEALRENYPISHVTRQAEHERCRNAC